MTIILHFSSLLVVLFAVINRMKRLLYPYVISFLTMLIKQQRISTWIVAYIQTGGSYFLFWIICKLLTFQLYYIITL